MGVVLGVERPAPDRKVWAVTERANIRECGRYGVMGYGLWVMGYGLWRLMVVWS